ncbi:IclR family transcriptional regulator [Bordetella sputigena]
MGSDAVQSVGRAIRLLRLVCGRRGGAARLSELISEGGLNKPTTHRLLKQLVQSGMLMQARDHRYYLGPTALELGYSADHGFPIRERAAPVLAEIARVTEDSVFLVVRVGWDSLCVARHMGAYPVKVFTVEPGHRQPMGVGAAGLAMLAALPAHEQELALNAIEPQLVRYPRLTAERLRSLIEVTRSKGWSAASDVAIEGVSAVGVPLLDRTGMPFAALSVGAVSLRMTKARGAYVAAMLIEHAKTLENSLLDSFQVEPE